MFQILNIVERGTTLSVSEGCLRLENKNSSRVLMVSLEDLEAVLVEEQAITLTGALLILLAETRIPVILCNNSHLPAAILFPLIQNGSEKIPVLDLQIQCASALKKRIWEKLIFRKVEGQSCNLQKFFRDESLLLFRERHKKYRVESIEARAAAIYWKRIPFLTVRDRHAKDSNILFNYVYSILYAAFAKSLCAVSLNPDFGLHHHNKYNYFALASDLMEPYRPLMDRCVFQFLSRNVFHGEFLPATRGDLLEIIYSFRVLIQGKKKMILDAVHDTVLSYKRCLKEKTVRSLLLPEIE